MPLFNPDPDGSLRTTLLKNILNTLLGMPTIPITGNINSITDQLLYDIWQTLAGGGGGGLLNVDVIPITYAQAVIDSGANNLLSGRTYAISGVHNGNCTAYLIAKSSSQFSTSGTCDYINAFTASSLKWSCDFDFANNYFSRLHDPVRNNTFTQSSGNFGAGVSLVEYIDFTNLALNSIDNIFNDCTSQAQVQIRFEQGQILGAYLNNVDWIQFVGGNAVQFLNMTGGSLNLDATNGSCGIYNCSFGSAIIALINSATLYNCMVGNNCSVILDGNTLSDCYIGNGKTINTDASLNPKNWTGKVLIGRVSTFDTIKNPDAMDVVDISSSLYQHIGVLTPNDNTASNRIATVLTLDDSLDIAIQYNNASFVIKDGANISHQGGDIDLDNAINKSVFVQMNKVAGLGSKLFVVYHSVQN